VITLHNEVISKIELLSNTSLSKYYYNNKYLFGYKNMKFNYIYFSNFAEFCTNKKKQDETNRNRRTFFDKGSK
jgi:hypothetical protein